MKGMGNGNMTKLKCERLMLSLKPSLLISNCAIENNIFLLFVPRNKVTEDTLISLSHHRGNAAWDKYYKKKLKK